jgi:hypothetical protein
MGTGPSCEEAGREEGGRAQAKGGVAMLEEWLIGAACILLVYLVLVNWKTAARERKQSRELRDWIRRNHGAE